MTVLIWGGFGLVVLATMLSGDGEAHRAPDSGQSPVPAGYRARRADGAWLELLNATNPAWNEAMEIGWGPQPYTTGFRALWTEEGLAIRFEATDDSPWHTLTERDDHIWNEEVVEIFIDPDGDGQNYAEIEINPVNVVCDLQIFDTEPRLRSDIDWDFSGLRSDVVPLRGQRGEPVGWTATALLPWEGFAHLDDTDVPLPPEPGDVWKFNVFRIKRPGGQQDPERDAVYAPWSPTPGPSFHAPSVFRDLEFVS